MELLIVIVVIGILAAISVVAYTGISQSAKNVATISAVEQTIKAINMYIAETGEYPVANNVNQCLTTVQSCVWGAPVIGGGRGYAQNLQAIAAFPILSPTRRAPHMRE